MQSPIATRMTRCLKCWPGLPLQLELGLFCFSGLWLSHSNLGLPTNGMHLFKLKPSWKVSCTCDLVIALTVVSSYLTTGTGSKQRPLIRLFNQTKYFLGLGVWYVAGAWYVLLVLVTIYLAPIYTNSRFQDLRSNNHSYQPTKYYIWFTDCFKLLTDTNKRLDKSHYAS